MNDRQALEREWLALTRQVLPALAAERGWPIRLDHCFQRVLLDNAAGGCWDDRIEGRPAYRHAAPDLLAEAVRLAEAARESSYDLVAANDRSLAWRRTRRAPGAARAAAPIGARPAPAPPERSTRPASPKAH